MRLLIVNSFYPSPLVPRIIGGAEVFARQLAEFFVSEGDEVEIIRVATTPNQVPETCNGVSIYSAPVRTPHPAFARPRRAPGRFLWHILDDWGKAAALISERIRAFRPDVLHSNNLSGLTTDVWQAARTHGIPIVHTLHDYYLTCPRCSRFSKGSACVDTCTSCNLLTINRKRLAQNVNAVVGVSQRILDIHTHLGLFSHTPIKTVIRNASQALDIANAPERKLTPPVFGFIGRLTEEKGIDLLVKAIASLPSHSVSLVIAGKTNDSEMQRLKALAPDADIKFLGFVAPSEFYRQVDVVVIPSLWEEPGALAAVEAMAVNKPVLGTPFGGLPEVIQDGVTGWIAKPDLNSFSEVIAGIVRSPQIIATITQTLQARVERRTFADVAVHYRDVYRRAMTTEQRN